MSKFTFIYEGITVSMEAAYITTAIIRIRNVCPDHYKEFDIHSAETWSNYGTIGKLIEDMGSLLGSGPTCDPSVPLKDCLSCQLDDRQHEAWLEERQSQFLTSQLDKHDDE